MNVNISFTGWLQVLFIGLKLAHVITWSWWLVLLPSLIAAGIAASVLLFLAVLAVITEVN